MTIETSDKRQVIDITERVASEIDNGASGLVTVFVQHTTAAVTLADLDPGTDEDFLEFLAKITPDVKWRHPHDPSHAPDHLLASLIGASVVIPVASGKLALGTWQRIVLVELDGPREREIVVSFVNG